MKDSSAAPLLEKVPEMAYGSSSWMTILQHRNNPSSQTIPSCEEYQVSTCYCWWCRVDNRALAKRTTFYPHLRPEPCDPCARSMPASIQLSLARSAQLEHPVTSSGSRSLLPIIGSGSSVPIRYRLSDDESTHPNQGHLCRSIHASGQRLRAVLAHELPERAVCHSHQRELLRQCLA